MKIWLGSVWIYGAENYVPTLGSYYDAKAIFMLFPDTIGDLIYRKENIGHILYLLSFTGIFIYLQQTLLGIMNGLGKQGILLRNSIVGYVIRILFVIYFVPSYGIAGYIAGMVVSSICVCILDIQR